MVVGGGGIAIIESAPGPDLEIWDGDGYEMNWTWPGHDLDMVWTRAWQFAQFKMFPIEVFIAVDMLLIANYFQSILNIFELRNHLK